MKSIKILMALAALSVTGTATATTISASRDVNSVVVRYGDLNLESQAGLKTLHKRIRNAAESVCSSLESKVLGLRGAYENCVKDAVASGIAAVDNPALSQFHANKGKRSVLASN